MNREIKFRIWSFIDKAFHYFQIEDYPSGIAGGVSEPQQFTGLKDKNGKDIYEGDIIKKTGHNLAPQFTYCVKPDARDYGQIGQVYVVVSLESGFTLVPDYTFKGGYICPNIFGNIGQYNFWNGASSATEIIGNIHENPDLLK